jgi:DNA-binding response OmpR family regulator
MAESASSEPRHATLLVYSSDAGVRDRVRIALGVRPRAGLELTIEEASTGAELVTRADAGGVDLAVLDGEAAPTGGLGLCRQLKDELDAPPPILVIIGRRDDAWLATWSRADGVVPHPIDALQLTDAVVSLLSGASVSAPGH